MSRSIRGIRISRLRVIKSSKKNKPAKSQATSKLSSITKAHNKNKKRVHLSKTKIQKDPKTT
jgi:hypothetical protein